MQNRNKKIHTIFLLQLKLDQKTVKIAHDINNAFGPRTTAERTAQLWFKKYRADDEILEDNERSRHRTLTTTQLRASVEAS